MDNLLNPKEIKEQVKKFENTLLTLRKFLDSAQREGMPAWQLDIREIEVFVADFERELLGLSAIQREVEVKRPEFEALEAVGIELLKQAKKLEIHNQADYEQAQRFQAKLTAHKELIEAKFAALIEALEQGCHRLLTSQQRLLTLCRLDTEGNA